MERHGIIPVSSKRYSVLCNCIAALKSHVVSFRLIELSIAICSIGMCALHSFLAVQYDAKLGCVYSNDEIFVAKLVCRPQLSFLSSSLVSLPN